MVIHFTLPPATFFQCTRVVLWAMHQHSFSFQRDFDPSEFTCGGVHRAGEKKNLLVMTGYCVQGTLGHAVVMGQRESVALGDGQTIDVKCAVRNVSFRYVNTTLVCYYIASAAINTTPDSSDRA